MSQRFISSWYFPRNRQCGNIWFRLSEIDMKGRLMMEYDEKGEFGYVKEEFADWVDPVPVGTVRDEEYEKRRRWENGERLERWEVEREKDRQRAMGPLRRSLGTGFN